MNLAIIKRDFMGYFFDRYVSHSGSRSHHVLPRIPVSQYIYKPSGVIVTQTRHTTKHDTILAPLPRYLHHLGHSTSRQVQHVELLNKKSATHTLSSKQINNSKNSKILNLSTIHGAAQSAEDESTRNSEKLLHSSASASRQNNLGMDLERHRNAQRYRQLHNSEYDKPDHMEHTILGSKGRFENNGRQNHAQKNVLSNNGQPGEINRNFAANSIKSRRKFEAPSPPIKR